MLCYAMFACIYLVQCTFIVILAMRRQNSPLGLRVAHD